MPNMTYPNQRLIKINREKATSDFLGIKNENWQAASRDLGAHALQLYLYLASNANGYKLALSPTAVRQAIGMARSTYHDQFHRLIDKGYLIPITGNSYAFFEVPQSAAQSKNSVTETGLNFEDDPSPDKAGLSDGQVVLAEDIQINNSQSPKYERTNKVEEVSKTIQKPYTSREWENRGFNF